MEVKLTNKKFDMTKLVTESRKIAFLQEYENLCRTFKIIITGCGCCGSPFTYSKQEMENGIITETFDELLKENIEHLSES